MKKIYILEDLDCANCAAKMEAAIAKVEGVESGSVYFFTQKLTLRRRTMLLTMCSRKSSRPQRKLSPTAQ